MLYDFSHISLFLVQQRAKASNNYGKKREKK